MTNYSPKMRRIAGILRTAVQTYRSVVYNHTVLFETRKKIKYLHYIIYLSKPSTLCQSYISSRWVLVAISGFPRLHLL